MATSALEAFKAACGSERSDVAEAADEATLEALREQGHKAWPEFDVDPIIFAEAAGSACAAGVSLDALSGDEVWLAAGCAARDNVALRAFDRTFLADLDRTLSHLRLDALALADVAQATRQKLLLGSDAGQPKLVAYAGRGQLKALVRVVATRAALDLVRKKGRRREVADADLTAVLIASTDPESIAATENKREVFRTAFEKAVAALTAEERTILRLYAVDGVGIDGVAAVAGIHRSTAARRLAKLRERIAEQTRIELEAIGLTGGELESVIGVVEEGLELTLSRVFAEPG